MIRQNWQLWSGVLDDKTCDFIISEAEKYPMEKGCVFSNAEVTTNTRRSDIRWMNECQAVGDLLWDFTQRANEVLKVDIEPMTDIQYTEYNGSEGGYYHNHHDIDWQKSDGRDRKLSITVQLSCPSEYTGGDFSFTEVETPPMDALKKRGSVLVFPSYLVHAVGPVTSGKRKSLVSWFEGPCWR